MTLRSTPISKTTRLAACLAAAGFLFVAPAVSAQTPLPPPTSMSTADARQDRIEELERQLRDATAENEQLQNQLNQANREVTRLRAMVGELAGVNQSLSTPPADGAAPAQQQPSGGAGPAPSSLNEAQRANTGTLGTVPAAAVPAPASDPAAEFQAARDLLNNGRLAEAEAAFGSYLENHGEAQNAGDARFWFAFTLLARNNYSDAAQNFVTYLQANPNAARAPEAQVRLGMALIGMGNTRQGCGAFNNLPRRYPNASRAVRDLATREARAAQCTA